MDVERVQRIADFMRDACGEKGERIEPLRLDRFFRRAPALRDVAQDNGVADWFGVAGIVDPGYIFASLDHQRHDIKIQESICWIKNFHVAADGTGRLRE